MSSVSGASLVLSLGSAVWPAESVSAMRLWLWVVDVLSGLVPGWGVVAPTAQGATPAKHLRFTESHCLRS